MQLSLNKDVKIQTMIPTPTKAMLSSED